MGPNWAPCTYVTVVYLRLTEGLLTEAGGCLRLWCLILVPFFQTGFSVALDPILQLTLIRRVGEGSCCNLISHVWLINMEDLHSSEREQCWWGFMRGQGRLKERLRWEEGGETVNCLGIIHYLINYYKREKHYICNLYITRNKFFKYR